MADIIAASASRADVQSAINSASDGDTVLIPNGSATWTTSISTTKQIIIRAQNYTPTFQPDSSTVRNVVITCDTTTAFALSMTTGNSFHVGVGGIKFIPATFNGQGGSGGIWGFVGFNGSGTKPALLFDCHFQINNRENVAANEAAFLSIDCLGGVVWNCFFDASQIPDGSTVAQKGASGVGIHLLSPRDWETQSTIGTRDTNGDVNTYFEDCHFYLWGQSDVDTDARVVVRNTVHEGCGWVTHGFTSGVGGRHLEIYDCEFNNTVDLRNCFRYVWIRAGTLVVTDTFVSNQNTGYGNPYLLEIGDNTNPVGSYPIDTAPGRGYHTSHVADPIYLWDNTGGGATVVSVLEEWATQVQEDRDYFVEAGAKPSTAGSPSTYEKYTYPHPFREAIEGEGEDPAPPQKLRIVNSVNKVIGTVKVFNRI